MSTEQNREELLLDMFNEKKAEFEKATSEDEKIEILSEMLDYMKDDEIVIYQDFFRSHSNLLRKIMNRTEEEAMKIVRKNNKK